MFSLLRRSTFGFSSLPFNRFSFVNHVSLNNARRLYYRDDMTSRVLNGEVDVQDLQSNDANYMIINNARYGEKNGNSFLLYKKIQRYHQITELAYRQLFINNSKDEAITKTLLADISKNDVPTSPIILGGLMVAMCKQGKIKKARKIVNRILELQSLPWYECSTIVEHLILHGYPEEAVDMFYKSETTYEQVLYHKLVTACINSENYDLIEFWYKQMNINGVAIDNRDLLKVFISAYGGNFTPISKIIDIIDLKGRSSSIYEVLFKSVLKSKKLTGEQKVTKTKFYLQSLLENKTNLEPNSPILEYILDIFIANGTHDDIKGFFKIIYENQFAAPASLIYRISDTLCNDKDICNLICTLLEKAKNKGTPAVRSLVYSKLMLLCCNNNDITRAFEYLNDMSSSMLIPNGIIYSQLITACVQKLRVDDVISLKKQSEEHNVALPCPIFIMMLDLFVKTHKEEYIKKYVEEMDRYGHRVDTSTYVSSLIDDGIREIYSESGIELAENPRKTSIQTEKCYNRLETFYLDCYSGNMENASTIIKVLKDTKAIIPSTVHETMIRFYGKTGNLEKGISWFEEYYPSCKNIRLYEALINILSFAPDHKKVISTFESLKSKGITPTLKMYNDIFGVYSQSNTFDVEDYEITMREMETNGIELNDTSYIRILQGLCKLGEYETAKKIIDRIPIDKNGYLHILVESYLHNNEPENAVSFVLEQENISLGLVKSIMRYLSLKKRKEHIKLLVKALQSQGVSTEDIVSCFAPEINSQQFFRN